MTEPLHMRHPYARLIAAGLFLAFGLLWLGFSSARTTDLIVGCLEGEGALSPVIACAYLQRVRAPDPNLPEADPLVAGPESAQAQTIFGTALGGYDATNPRAVELLDHLIATGVDWESPHDVGLPPLHIAVRELDADLVARFLAAGASPTVRADDPGKVYHGDTALEFLARTRATAPDHMRASVARIEAMLSGQ